VQLGFQPHISSRPSFPSYLHSLHMTTPTVGRLQDVEVVNELDTQLPDAETSSSVGDVHEGQESVERHEEAVEQHEEPVEQHEKSVEVVGGSMSPTNPPSNPPSNPSNPPSSNLPPRPSNVPSERIVGKGARLKSTTPVHIPPSGGKLLAWQVKE